MGETLWKFESSRPHQLQATPTKLMNIEAARHIMRSLVVAALLAVGCCTGAMAQTVGGKYTISGTNLDGSPYGGTATIVRTSNSTCRIRWETGATSDGICMLANRSFAAAYVMENAFGLVVYELLDDGSLRGVWTIADKSGAGTEVLTPVK